MGRKLTKLDRKLERFVAWLDLHYVGPVLRFTAGLVVVLTPFAKEYSDTRRTGWLADLLHAIDNPVWLIPFGLAVLVLIPLQHYAGGAPRIRLLRRLGRVHGSFAGSLFSFGEKIEAAKQRKLEDAQCDALCAALLHRIRDFTAIGLNAESSPRLRATLAVPYSTTGGSIDALRVWCYDETHEDRGFTIIPLVLDGKVAPGSPAAYHDGGMQIIADIRKVPGPASARARPYISVLSIPLSAKGVDGKPLAVVSVDADEPDFFDSEQVMERVYPLVTPVVNALGLVLLSRRKKGHAYEFPR